MWQHYQSLSGHPEKCQFANYTENCFISNGQHSMNLDKGEPFLSTQEIPQLLENSFQWFLPNLHQMYLGASYEWIWSKIGKKSSLRFLFWPSKGSNGATGTKSYFFTQSSPHWQWRDLFGSQIGASWGQISISADLQYIHNEGTFFQVMNNSKVNFFKKWLLVHMLLWLH